MFPHRFANVEILRKNVRPCVRYRAVFILFDRSQWAPVFFLAQAAFNLSYPRRTSRFLSQTTLFLREQHPAHKKNSPALPRGHPASGLFLPGLFYLIVHILHHRAARMKSFFFQTFHPPVKHALQNRPQAFPFLCKGIFHLWRNHRIYLPVDQPVSFQLPQLLRQHFCRRLGNQPAKLGKTHHTIR